MKSVKIYFASLVLMAVVAASCNKDFLEIDPMQNTDASKAITDIAGLRAAVTGVYSLFQSADNYGRTATLLPDLMADNLYISVLNANRYQPQDQYVTAANDGMATGLWNNLYNVVANANLIIEKGPGIEVAAADTAEKRRLVGQAYAQRALAYFNLVNFFAQPYNFTAGATHLGVPIVTATSTDKSSVVAPARSTVKQTYDQIISDLNNAIANLSSYTTATSATKGKFNLYGAQALLSRVYLYKGDWQGSVDMATAVISANKYSLLPRATFVDDFKKQYTAESIFEVVNTTTDNLSTNSIGYFYNQSGYGDALATDGIYNAYAATDVRKGFITRSRRTGSGGENPANIVNKYSNVSTFDENVKVIRLAEMYLNRAEANAQLGKDDLARTDVNVIISRSNSDATAVIPATTTGAALLTAILNERRKELAFEGHRLFDLTRNKLSFTKIRRGGLTINVTYPNEKTILPIPQRELDANPNIRGQQNPGY